MANPYEWSSERDDRSPRFDEREEEARRAAERHAGQDRSWEAGRGRPQRGDYGSGWYGEEAASRGRDVPGPYGRAPEQASGDPGAYDRYSREDQRPEARDRRLAMEAEAYGAGRSLGRGWRRLQEGVRHVFDDRRPGEYAGDPSRREGGMFGGQDRTGSLFSHDDGLPAPAPGPHRGKGPRGYARSDARILEDISDRLADDGRIDASDIEIKVEAGEVTLNGQVESRQDKRRAEDLAEQVSGVRHLQNNLRVRPDEPAPAEGRTAQADDPDNAQRATGGIAGNQDIADPAPRPATRQ